MPGMTESLIVINVSDQSKKFTLLSKGLKTDGFANCLLSTPPAWIAYATAGLVLKPPAPGDPILYCVAPPTPGNGGTPPTPRPAGGTCDDAFGSGDGGTGVWAAVNWCNCCCIVCTTCWTWTIWSFASCCLCCIAAWTCWTTSVTTPSVTCWVMPTPCAVVPSACCKVSKCALCCCCSLAICSRKRMIWDKSPGLPPGPSCAMKSNPITLSTKITNPTVNPDKTNLQPSPVVVPERTTGPAKSARCRRASRSTRRLMPLQLVV